MATAHAELLHIINHAENSQVEIDNSGNTPVLAGASNQLFQLNHKGQILENNKKRCMGVVCKGWSLFDQKPRAVQISADNRNASLFQPHNSEYGEWP